IWGLTVPLSKLALGWLDPAWLATARFALAAPVLALAARRSLRAALDARVAAWGALGYGAVLLLQNLGMARTSVSHAALIVGAVRMAAAAVATLPVSMAAGAPAHAAPSAAALIAFALLVTVGSVLPFAFYAYGQARVPAEVAGAFVNLEPLVGAALGALAFRD